MTTDPEVQLEPRTAAYLRDRGDVRAPADLLEAVRDEALAPKRDGWLSWLAPAVAGSAAIAMAAVVAVVSFQPGRTATVGAGGCPVTVPDGSFRAPPPWPAEPPASYESHWYGTADLWTMLHIDGNVWDTRGLPIGAKGVSDKSFWWSTAFNATKEYPVDITVDAVRLDDPVARPISVGDRGTNAIADFGVAMLIGVTLPSTGCWELTASYKGHTLSYTVLVE